MDSSSLADLARAGVAAFRRDGAEELLPYLAPDVVWEDDPEWPDGQTWRGHDQVRAMLHERLETTSIVLELEELAERDGRVLLMMRWIAEGHGSGAVGVLRPAALFDYEQDLVSRVRFFLDRDRARAALESG